MLINFKLIKLADYKNVLLISYLFGISNWAPTIDLSELKSTVTV